MIALGEWVRVGDWLGREIGDGASLLMSPGTAEQSDDALMTALLARVQQTIAQMNPPIDRCSFSVGIDARLRCDVHALGSGEQRHYLVWLYANPGTEITHPYFEAGCFDALGVVIGGIAHDLRGRLNNIVVNMELLKSAGEYAKTSSQLGSGESTKYRDIAVQQVRHIDKAIQSLIEIISLAPAQTTLFNLGELLAEVHSTLLSTARLHGVKLAWEPFHDGALVQGDKPGLRRALLHMILAALRASRQGDTLRMELLTTADEVLFALQNERSGGAAMAALFGPPLGDMTVNIRTATAVSARSLWNSLDGTIRYDTAHISGDSGGFRIEFGLPQSKA